jgi:hypothetical protein
VYPGSIPGVASNSRINSLGDPLADLDQSLEERRGLGRDSASSNTAIAEAEIAKALGYELCKCDFPPTPMRTVGYFNRHPRRAGV